MAQAMRLGIDCSNYTGYLSSPQVQSLLSAGVEWAIVGTQNPDIARQQIISLEADGIEVPAVYCFLYWDSHDDQRIDDARTFGKPVWLDCEYVREPMPDWLTIRVKITEAVARCGDSFAGIYTGAWWWPKYTNEMNRAFDCPLWHADYRPRPESLVLSHPYGGWTKAAIWQWSSAGLGGVNVDLNVMEDAPMPEPTPPQPTEVEALRALVRAGAIITAGDQSLETELTPKEKSDLDWIANTANGR